jgi:UDP:flavonoid glycosyltransferase YjiC (YdhE family)
MAPKPKRILLATIGSLGDLHPCIALAQALRERGHRPFLASTEVYRAKVEALGFEFHSLRPDFSAANPALIRNVMHMRRGPEFLLCKLILPALRDTYLDLAAAAKTADLILAGEIVFAAPLVAEALQMPWVAAILSPFSFFSAFDPPVSPMAPALTALRNAGPGVNRAILNVARLATYPWWKPVRRLRRELGLSQGGNALFDDKFSRDLTLALFSPELARPQSDWPPNTVQTGFVYYDQGDGRAGLPPQLSEFLAAGEPPIAFTLGSTAVHDPRGFFEQSAEAARMLGKRAVFLTGDHPPSIGDPAQAIAVPYAPHSELFPRVAAVVHQGGVGTTAQTLRAGRPALIMPCGFDQPDNAARVERLGAGITLSRSRYNARTAARALEKLLGTPNYASTAEAVGRSLLAENGLEAACDAIEKLLTTAARSPAALRASAAG